MEVQRTSPGRVRDALVHVMSQASSPLAIKDLETRVNMILGPTPSSSIRSYLRLNTPELFFRVERGVYSLRDNTFVGGSAESVRASATAREFTFGKATLFHADCLEWIQTRPSNSIHAVVTDPPYGLHEYTDEQQRKLKDKKGGVWRIPPALGGHQRSPLPRFTTLTREQLIELRDYFGVWASLLLPKMVPGAHLVMASNPLVSYIVSNALADAGFERRGEIARLTTTLRGGDRPKNAHEEFSEVTVMPRSRWEPWIVVRKPLDGRVQDNLRRWKTGGFRRISEDKPFADVIVSSPTKASEKKLAPHLSLKPQSFLRKLVRAVLPLGEGVIVDPFAGSGSTLAAAEFKGYDSVGVESNEEFFEMACQAIPKLARLKVKEGKSEFRD